MRSTRSTLRKGEPIVAIDRAKRTVRTEAGAVEPYDTLIIATGSKPILIPVPGAELPGVVTFRDLDDVDAMLAAAGARRQCRRDRRRPARARSGRGPRHQGHEDHGRAPDADLDGASARSERRLSAAARDREARHRDPHQRQHPGDHRRREGRGRSASTTAARCRPISSSWRSASVRTSQLAKDAGLEVKRGRRGRRSPAAPATRTSIAVGECVEHRGQCYGLVAPLYDMAKTLARHARGRGRRRATPARPPRPS